MAVRRIFAQRGEPAFRELERRTVEAALHGPPGVVAPGGGWAAQGANMEYAARSALLVYLSTDPSEAAQRAAPEGSRPLLDGPNPAARMEELLAAREGSYRAAEEVVPTDGRSVEEVAAALVQLARSRAGW
jgi:shikimate kinase